MSDVDGDLREAIMRHSEARALYLKANAEMGASYEDMMRDFARMKRRYLIAQIVMWTVSTLNIIAFFLTILNFTEAP